MAVKGNEISIVRITDGTHNEILETTGLYKLTVNTEAQTDLWEANEGSVERKNGSTTETLTGTIYTKQDGLKEIFYKEFVSTSDPGYYATREKTAGQDGTLKWSDWTFTTLNAKNYVQTESVLALLDEEPLSMLVNKADGTAVKVTDDEDENHVGVMRGSEVLKTEKEEPVVDQDGTKTEVETKYYQYYHYNTETKELAKQDEYRVRVKTTTVTTTVTTTEGTDTKTTVTSVIDILKLNDDDTFTVAVENVYFDMEKVYALVGAMSYKKDNEVHELYVYEKDYNDVQNALLHLKKRPVYTLTDGMLTEVTGYLLRCDDDGKMYVNENASNTTEQTGLTQEKLIITTVSGDLDVIADGNVIAKLDLNDKESYVTYDTSSTTKPQLVLRFGSPVATKSGPPDAGMEEDHPDIVPDDAVEEATLTITGPISGIELKPEKLLK